MPKMGPKEPLQDNEAQVHMDIYDYMHNMTLRCQFGEQKSEARPWDLSLGHIWGLLELNKYIIYHVFLACNNSHLAFDDTYHTKHTCQFTYILQNYKDIYRINSMNIHEMGWNVTTVYHCCQLRKKAENVTSILYKWLCKNI